MKIIAYKCTDTGKIFEWKRDYDRHRRRYLADQRKIVNRQNLLQDIENKIAKFRNTAQTIGEIEQWILANSKFLAHRHNVINHGKKTTIEFLNVNINVEYRESVSNTHSAPFNHVQNWAREKHLPMSYPGWHGRVEFRYNGKVDGFFSDMFRKSGIYLGTGSGGGDWYSSEIILWGFDWPGIYSEKVFDILSKSS